MLFEMNDEKIREPDTVYISKEIRQQAKLWVVVDNVLNL